MIFRWVTPHGAVALCFHISTAQCEELPKGLGDQADPSAPGPGSTQFRKCWGSPAPSPASAIPREGCDAAEGEEGSSTLLLCSLHQEWCASQTGLSRWEITETSLTCLQTLQVNPDTVHSSTWWHQVLYYVPIDLFFFLWGGGKGVRGFSIIRVSHPLSDLVAVGHFFWSRISPVASWIKLPPPLHCRVAGFKIKWKAEREGRAEAKTCKEGNRKKCARAKVAANCCWHHSGTLQIRKTVLDTQILHG